MKYRNDVQTKPWNIPAMLRLLTAEDSCIVNEIHALVLTCRTAIPVFHSYICTLATNKKTNKQTSAVRKAKEENQMYKDANFVHVI